MPKSSGLNQPSTDVPAGVFLLPPPATKPSILVKSVPFPEEGDIFIRFLFILFYTFKIE